MLDFRKKQPKSVSIWVFWGLGVEVVEQGMVYLGHSVRRQPFMGGKYGGRNMWPWVVICSQSGTREK